MAETKSSSNSNLAKSATRGGSKAPNALLELGIATYTLRARLDRLERTLLAWGAEA